MIGGADAFAEDSIEGFRAAAKALLAEAPAFDLKTMLRVVAKGGETPILVLVDTQGQLMARRDEMRGLNEYLAHLAKCLLLASQFGHRTIGLEYGEAAAGALLATGLATDRFIGLPGAAPSMMDLPSISRVTKLPLDTARTETGL